jgi:Cu-Zn family superoxide dismutase
MRWTFRPLLAALLPLALAAFAFAADEHKADHKDEPALPKKAIALLIPTEGNQVRGTLTLTVAGDKVHVTGKVTGLTPGEHGFHIHEFGDMTSADGTAAGGHYNPGGHKHGGLEDKERHAGDLGNIKADKDGVAMVDVKADVKLHFILGRAFVVHAKADDFKTQPTGDAGGRVALGLIGLANDKPPMPKK